MSSRQLRKLQQQQELAAQTKLQAQEEEESEEELVAPAKSKASLFANLAELEDNDEEEDEVEDEPEEAVESKPSVDPAPTTAKKSKKSKKKKKAKAKAKDTLEASGDDIDAALEQLAIERPFSHNGQAKQNPVDPAYERVCELLGVSTNHLKVGTEMRNLFGKDVMGNHDDAGGALPRARGGRRQQAQQQMDLESALKGRHAPGKGLLEVTLRRNIFVQGKEDWPRAAGTLRLETTEGNQSNDETHARFIHDEAYQALQQNFHAFVEMGDPQNLIGLLQRNRMCLRLLHERC